MAAPSIHGLIEDACSPGVSTIDALEALGELKAHIREREVELVHDARQQGETWADIAAALQRDPSLMDLLYGKGTHGA
jgi:hypothetical protein